MQSKPSRRDGYTGVIPKNAATIGEVLKDYGYHTAAFGKWHNTPAIETTSIGPKDHWPNAYGFEYFYGFLGGETSQWEPRLTENYDAVEPPEQDPNYHLTQDLVDKALKWLDDYRAFDPNKATPGTWPCHFPQEGWRYLVSHDQVPICYSGTHQLGTTRLPNC